MVRQVVRWSAAPAVLALFVLAATAAPGPMAATAPDEKPAPINVNEATAAELEQLPGVGPSLAQRIVEFREKNGPFGSVDELLKVRGIGEKSLERFRHLVTVGKVKKS